MPDTGYAADVGHGERSVRQPAGETTGAPPRQGWGWGGRAQVQVGEARHPLIIRSFITIKDSGSSLCPPILLLLHRKLNFWVWGQCLDGVTNGLRMRVSDRYHFQHSKRQNEKWFMCEISPNYILPQALEQLRALFGNQAYFLNVGAVS